MGGVINKAMDKRPTCCEDDLACTKSINAMTYGYKKKNCPKVHKAQGVKEPKGKKMRSIKDPFLQPKDKGRFNS